MLKTEEYKEKLIEVLKEVKILFDIAEIRGSDVGSFIFAKKENRAIEIYQSENAVIVEFWENEKMEREKQVNSYEKVTKLVVDFMKG